ncbi:aminotransferase class V-fold PLP-dependent enzyme, partial [Streptomyces sp. NPDC127084]|uniref:aminotransferase class V-fold PLP-dependent enzyme n=1 Tax=Streptomyces sp. NPDC127084 TaxID=3347133 RepID=UPI00365FFE39
MTAQLAVTGNASSLHAAGRRARRTVEEARETLADALGARPSEVVFTSGGTEADNLAVKGLYWARRDADPRRTRVLSSPGGAPPGGPPGARGGTTRRECGLPSASGLPSAGPRG